MNETVEIWVEAIQDGDYTTYWSTEFKNTFLIVKKTSGVSLYYKGHKPDTPEAITERNTQWTGRATLGYKEYCELDEY